MFDSRNDPSRRAHPRAWLVAIALAILSIPAAGIALAHPAPIHRTTVALAAPQVRRHAEPHVRRHVVPKVRRHVEPWVRRHAPSDRAAMVAARRANEARTAAGMAAGAAVVRYAAADWVRRHPAPRPRVRRHAPVWASPAPLVASSGPWTSWPDWALWRCTALHESGPAPGTSDGVWWTNEAGPFSGAFDIARTTWAAYAGVYAQRWPDAGTAPPEDQILGARLVRAAVGSSRWGGLRSCGG